jgi:protoporphyrinogen oxidase
VARGDGESPEEQVKRSSVVILGGGLSGMGAAHALTRAGWNDVTIVERAGELGGLAGTFRRGEHFYPLAYHHILHRDTTLLYFLQHIGALDRVRWRRIRMVFRLADRAYDLARPGDFLRFPMSLGDKIRFVRLMLRCFNKDDWSDWEGRNAADLIDQWAGPGVREAMFEPLTDLKFRLPCREVSAAWLGARLHYREGSAPLGFIPGTNWTKVLCEGLGDVLERAGVKTLLRRRVVSLPRRDDRLVGAELDDGERIEADLVINTLPVEIYRRMAPDDATAQLDSIRYTAVVSAICATRQAIEPDFYWMNLPTRNFNACGIFRLESLNPTIGAPGDACVNFVTHLPDRQHTAYGRSDDELVSGYLDDFRRLFGFDLDPFWTHLNRLPMYSPVFHPDYRNPPAKSTTFGNLYFAGNYRTFPSIASTGTALASGVTAAAALIADQGGQSALPQAIDRFRLAGMPRG